MVEEKPIIPSHLIWMHGFVCGLSIPSALAIGASARADAEPTLGPTAGALIQWAAKIAFMFVVVLMLRWLLRRGWVRAWFAAAPEWKLRNRAGRGIGQAGREVLPRVSKVRPSMGQVGSGENSDPPKIPEKSVTGSDPGSAMPVPVPGFTLVVTGDPGTSGPRLRHS